MGDGTARTWRWWWFAAPPLIAFFTTLWSYSMLGTTREPLYALFGHSDSAGRIFWKPGGEAAAYAAVELPYRVGLSVLLITMVIGAFAIGRSTGWRAAIAFAFYCVACALGLSVVFGWVWINVVGVFI